MSVGGVGVREGGRVRGRGREGQGGTSKLSAPEFAGDAFDADG